MNLEANKTALFAGGCFWCMESAFDHIPGVIEVINGYTGGHVKDPTYEQVSMGETGHFEAIKVTYEPQKITYDSLLDVFWRNIDPFDEKGQFGDKGPSYKSAIFCEDQEQKDKAEATKKQIEDIFNQPVFTEILEASTFYPAEEHHQKYYKKNPIRHKIFGYDRQLRLEEIWETSRVEAS